MFRFLNIFSLLPVTLVAACGATYPSRPVDPDYLGGSEAGDAASNGLEYSDGSQLLVDSENRDISVRMVRFQRNFQTGQTEIVISDETVVLAPGFSSFDDPSAIVTFDGYPLVFADGEGQLPSGQPIKSYLNAALTYSGTGAIYSYNKDFPEGGFENPIDTEGFYAFGFETDPSAIAALNGEVSYQGSFYGYGQFVALDGALLDDEVRTIGAISMSADFSADTISGRLDGFFDPVDANTPYLMVFFDAPIVGNAFAASPDMICERSVSCISQSSLGGVFYGPDGAEASGVIGFDETMDPAGSDPAARFVGAAGFSSEVVSE